MAGQGLCDGVGGKKKAPRGCRVGGLATARSRPEYRRRAGSVTRRVEKFPYGPPRTIETARGAGGRPLHHVGSRTAAARHCQQSSDLPELGRLEEMGMQLGMIGLGRMGANIVRRIVRDGHTAVGYSRHEDQIKEFTAELGESFTGTTDYKTFVALLEKPRIVWVMIPAGATGAVIDQVAELLDPGDIIIDGGNSRYHEDIRRAKELAPKGIHYLDIGTSGGVWGLERGYCLMIGGEAETVKHVEPLLRAIAPGVDAAERTPGRTGEPSPAEQGYLHCGPAGAGHFVKMVHNGIEYGAMQAYAEGMNILHKANIGKTVADEHSAEETPLEHPEHYQYDIDVAEVTEVWRRGSVVASWLLDLTAAALHADPELSTFGGRVSDSGEGRWTIHAAIDEGVPAPVLSAALYQRFSSRGEALYSDKVLSAMRKAFGGHNELPGK